VACGLWLRLGVWLWLVFRGLWLCGFVALACGLWFLVCGLWLVFCLLSFVFMACGYGCGGAMRYELRETQENSNTPSQGGRRISSLLNIHARKSLLIYFIKNVYAHFRY
jgi:hypothetical protein